jgi:hypothetical protein
MLAAARSMKTGLRRFSQCPVSPTALGALRYMCSFFGRRFDLEFFRQFSTFWAPPIFACCGCCACPS